MARKNRLGGVLTCKLGDKMQGLQVKEGTMEKPKTCGDEGESLQRGKC